MLRCNLRREEIHNEKPTCVTCEKRNYRKLLHGISGCFCFGKVHNKMTDCPTIRHNGIQGNKIAPKVPNDYAPNKRHFYALRTRGSRPDDDDDDDNGAFLLFIIDMSPF